LILDAYGRDLTEMVRWTAQADGTIKLFTASLQEGIYYVHFTGSLSSQSPVLKLSIQH